MTPKFLQNFGTKLYSLVEMLSKRHYSILFDLLFCAFRLHKSIAKVMLEGHFNASHLSALVLTWSPKPDLCWQVRTQLLGLKCILYHSQFLYENKSQVLAISIHFIYVLLIIKKISEKTYSRIINFTFRVRRSDIDWLFIGSNSGVTVLVGYPCS